MNLTVYIAIIGALLAIEAVRALTPLQHPLGRRWLGNVAIYVCSVLLHQLLTFAQVVGGASFAAASGIGVFQWLSAPTWLVAIVVFCALDLTGYLTHRIEHAVPILWRMHRTHHSDPDLDVTTGLRFHPLEVVVRGSVGAAVMALLGAPVDLVAGCVFVYGLVSLISHLNVPLLPTRIEVALQSVLVTPRVHRIHHSLDLAEANSNFGVALSVWDRVFGTYRARPNLPYAQMCFGVSDRSAEESMAIGQMLLDPLKNERRRALPVEPL